MSVIEHVSRYLLVHPDQIFQDYRTFCVDVLKGEELHENLRKVEEDEKEYRILSKYLPNLLDCACLGVSLLTGDIAYLPLLLIPEGWRMAEMESGFLYRYYSKKLEGYRQSLLEKYKTEVGDAVDKLFDEDPFEAQEMESLGVLDPEDVNGKDGSAEGSGESDSEEEDEGPSRPWDKEDDDGWKTDNTY